MAENKDVELLKKQITDFKRAVNSVKPMNSDYLTGYISALSAVEGAIAEQPAADVVKVVMCKDCKRYTDFNMYNRKRLEFHYCDKFGNIMLESDFCSYGERKDG